MKAVRVPRYSGDSTSIGWEYETLTLSGFQNYIIFTCYTAIGVPSTVALPFSSTDMNLILNAKPLENQFTI